MIWKYQCESKKRQCEETPTWATADARRRSQIKSKILVCIITQKLIFRKKTHVDPAETLENHY